MLTRDEAICLRTVNYSETSQVVTLFAREHGKLGALAKGSRRAKSSFDGPIEIFSCGRIMFSMTDRPRLAVLTEFEQQPRFIALRRNLYGLNCGLFAAELVESLTEQSDPHPELYDRFVQFLEDVQGAAGQYEALTLLIVFQLALLREVGAQPVLARCANCRAENPAQWRKAWFSSRANGLLCPDCEQAFVDKMPLIRETVTSLADLRRLADAHPATLNQIEKMLIYHFSELMHRQPRMAATFLSNKSRP